MKRGGKIALWIVGVLVGICIFIEVGADVVASHFLDKRVRQAITNAELPYIIEFDHINFLVSAGVLIVPNIHFVNDSVLPDGTKEVVDIQVKKIQINLAYYNRLYRAKHLCLHTIVVDEPKVMVWSKKKPKDKPKYVEHTINTTIQTVADSMAQNKDLTTNYIRRWIHQTSLDELQVRNASLTWYELGSHMAMEATGVDARMQDFVYDLFDNDISYCDSLYSLQVKQWRMLSSDGLIQMEVHDIQTQDAGVITIGTTHIGHSVPKKQLARMVKEPTDWIDMYINRVEIAATNLLRENWSKGVRVPYITMDVERFEDLRDERFEKKHPYKMPQPVLMKMDFPIQLDQVDVMIHQLDIGVLKTDKNYGKIQLHNANASICNFTNRRGGVIEAQVSAILGKGSMSGVFKMHLNKACKWEMALSAKDVDVDFINPLIRPLVAIEVDCHIDSLVTVYKGNKTSASGTFMLGYTGISAKVYKNLPIPYKQISQNAGAIEYFVNNLIPKSNPKYAGKPATVYSIEWEWKPEKESVPFYFFAPVIMGAVETYLPGLFIGKKIKTTNLPIK